MGQNFPTSSRLNTPLTERLTEKENGLALENLFQRWEKLCSGVGTGCFVFVAMLFIAPIFAGGANAFFAEKTGAEWQLTALCCILISVGFYIPSLIYENEKLALWLRTLIHMTIGTIVYLLTAYFAGWMASDLVGTALRLLIALGAAAIIWLCIFLYIKGQARKMNQKIKEKQQDE